jgi:hypothetical protein
MSVTWVTTTDVEAALGVPANDADWLAQVTAAANAWAYQRRLAAGYVDDEATAPNDAAKTGTVLYAKTLYLERGSADGFQSFDQIGGFVPTGGLGQVNRLLGIPRPAVA